MDDPLVTKCRNLNNSKTFQRRLNSYPKFEFCSNLTRFFNTFARNLSFEHFYSKTSIWRTKIFLFKENARRLRLKWSDFGSSIAYARGFVKWHPEAETIDSMFRLLGLVLLSRALAFTFPDDWEKIKRSMQDRRRDQEMEVRQLGAKSKTAGDGGETDRSQ